MNKVTILTILVVVLVIINGISLFMQLNRHDRRKDGMTNPRLLFKKLQLDNQQEQQFEELRKSHFERRDALRAEDIRLRKEMASMISQDISDAGKIDSITNLLAANRKQFELNFYSHFQRLHSILKPEQKPKFEEIMNEIIQRQTPPERKAPNDPPPR